MDASWIREKAWDRIVKRWLGVRLSRSSSHAGVIVLVQIKSSFGCFCFCLCGGT